MMKQIDDEQMMAICDVIGTWYLEWKDKIVDGGAIHRLGFAREDLKAKLEEMNIFRSHGVKEEFPLFESEEQFRKILTERGNKILDKIKQESYDEGFKDGFDGGNDE